ncbi:hypothetical protein BC830DRAFT_12345 [Chytriomyces sp. MP71]|nr:hypothetical protein BC830DRAFT_12345 [Chytriomyces sp. MP71]
MKRPSLPQLLALLLPLAAFFVHAQTSSGLPLPTAPPSNATTVAQNNSEVIAYLLLEPATALPKLNALAVNPHALPFTRLVLSFIRPDMVYIPSSFTLERTGLEVVNASSASWAGVNNASNFNDYGFAELKKLVTILQAGGIEVFLSVGGWNFNCFAYLYMKYSIAYFVVGPNAWKLNGDPSSCTPNNQFCYVCEPPTEGTTLADFAIFPEPTDSPTWQAAQAYISSNPLAPRAEWHPEIVGGSVYNATKTNYTVIVPGTAMWKMLQRDPYQDVVYLAKDLGVSGIDLDYEEIWHADTFRTADSPQGPFHLDQTVLKYTAIARDLMINIQSLYPTCKLSVAAAAAGAWQGPWWGGNLKGLWYWSQLWYPAVTEFMTVGTNAGGVNAMTYDLSQDDTFHECPSATMPCDLASQVAFYLAQFRALPLLQNARVGFETGTPAYPDATHDAHGQLPLTTAALAQIAAQVDLSAGAILWELYKRAGPGEANATAVLQAVCAKALGVANARCVGVVPAY